MSRRPLRLLHTSDVHLGPAGREPDGGRFHAHECVCPVDVMEHLVKEHDVDLVLVAGDLFDHARVSAAHVEQTFTRFAALPAEVALLPGNHDVLDETALYRRHRFHVDAARVHFFDDPAGTTHDLFDGSLRIWAKAMEEHAPRYEPLSGAPAHPGDRWYVVAGHGHFSPAGAEGRSSPIVPDAIDASGADYVALGHWHVMTDLSTRGVATPAWYPGAPLFGFGAGHMLLVDLVPGRPVVVTPVPVLDHPASRCG